MKSIFKFFLDPIPLAFVITGAVLMNVALQYNINPVCGAAVQEEIANHPACLTILEITTLPAMFIGVILISPVNIVVNSHSLISNLVYVSFYTWQIVLYFLVGKIISLGLRAILSKRAPPDGKQV